MDRILTVNGVDVTCERIGFTEGVEQFNTYLLDDGTVLRVKLVLTDVWMVPGATNPDGSQTYVIGSQNVVVAESAGRS